jgi:hypothetical protein
MARSKKNIKPAAIVAEICLYGRHSDDVGNPIGHGFIARTRDGRSLGDGECHAGRGATSALWLALDELEKVLPRDGRVLVFAPGGLLVAETTIGARRYFGDLKWEAAPVLAISAEAIEAAAERGAGA